MISLSEPTKHYDIIIAGGGMVGATAALCLAQLGLSIAIIEATQPEQESSVSFDQRSVALSASSVAIYRSLGIWDKLQSIACPIKRILVSDQGHFGFTRLNASEQNLDALGEVIPLDQAGPILWQMIEKELTIDSFCPAKVKAIKILKPHSQVSLKQEGKTKFVNITGKLILAADGTYSAIAKHLAIDTIRTPYKQHAVIANITTQQAHQNRAYERFTSSGPLALLPLTNNLMSLVWCQKPEQIDQVMTWNDDEFMAELQKSFGYRLGKITQVGKRFEYPLSLHLSQPCYKDNVLLLGNSAHTLHPIAGQGFNLGLRDIAALSEQIAQAMAQNLDFGNGVFLQEFNKARSADWKQTIFATDSLVRLFSNDFLPLAMLRNKVMNLVNNVPFLKQRLAKASMGFAGHSSRLARNLTQKTAKGKASVEK